MLVVIGILIALQINDWNENRKTRLQEITILENIKEGISLDTFDIRFNIDRFNIDMHNKFIVAQRMLLKFLLSKQDIPQDPINYSHALSVPLMINLHDPTYTNSQNNQIGIISNNQLKKDISRFYDFFMDSIIKLENEKLGNLRVRHYAYILC